LGRWELKKTHNQDTVLLAGWLFADLLLGLSMIFLIMNFRGGGISAITPTATVTPSPTPTKTPTPIPTPTSTIISSNRITPSPFPTGTLAAPGLGEAQCYNVNLTSEDVIFQERSVINQLEYQIPDQEDLKAGLVLVWAHGKNLGEGVIMAKKVGQVLQENFPESFGNDTQLKSLYFEAGDLYHVQLEVYFFTTGSWESGFESTCEYVR